MKFFFYIIVGFVSLSHVYAEDTPLTSEQLKNALSPDISTSVTWAASGEQFLDQIFGFVRDGLFGVLSIIVLFVFLYIAVKLIIARGNPEEFKKALNSFIYAAVGIFLVAFAWVLVRLVAGLSI